MSKVKSTGTLPVISSSKKPLSVNHVLFSFKYLTKNSKHSFNFFGKKDFREAQIAYHELFDKMQEVSNMSMTEFSGLPKEKGYELMRFEDFPKSTQAILSNTGIVTKDKKLAIMRFYRETCRMISQPDVNHDSIWHVICFDFDKSAYDHGR